MNLTLPSAPVYTDVWTTIASAKLPVVMYGMGNGADRIADKLGEYGVEISDYFASDGFVRGHYFRGKKVLTYGETAEKYSDFIIVLGFASSLPDVIDRIAGLSKMHTLYAPDMPVCEGDVFDMQFYNTHYAQISEVYEMLADEDSKHIFASVINYKLSGDISYLLSAVSEPAGIWEDLLTPARYSRALDGGAYNGDTIRELLLYADNLTEVIAAEPDERTYKKLAAYAETEDRCIIEIYKTGLWSEKTTLSFNSKGGRSSSLSISQDNSGKVAEFDTVDNILGGRRVDYIKFDLEGAEENALAGAHDTINRYHPDMLISLYHKSADVFKIPLQLMEICKGYKLYLRRFSYIPAWDLNLYAVFEENEQ